MKFRKWRRRKPGFRRRIVRAVAFVAGLVPVRLFPTIRVVEAACQVVQGMRWGGGPIEDEVRAVLRFLPSRGAVVFDVGAHRGIWTKYLLRHATDRVARIYAFEPQIEFRELVCVRDARIEFIPLAVGDRVESRRLYVPPDAPSAASVHGTRGQVLHVEVITLDDFAEAHGITRVDLVKLDIEGNELAALRGATSLLENHRLRTIAFEFGTPALEAGVQFRQLWDYLSKRDYQIARIIPKARLLPISDYQPYLESYLNANYVAWTTG